MSTERLYYIQDTRSYCGNSCFWWREDGEGYCTDLNEAWKVTKEKALAIIRSRPDVDVAWPCSVIDSEVTMQFDMQKLRGKKPLTRELRSAK